MADVSVLREEAERFAPFTETLDAERLARFQARLAAAEGRNRIPEVVAALDAGRPAETAALMQEIADELCDIESSGALVYWTAVATRLPAEDLEHLMAAIEGRLSGPQARDPELWDQTRQGQALSESVNGRLVPVAGLDVQAALEYTRIYLANFPLFSRPLGDVDRRAAAWIAQILDIGSTRATLRLLLARLAEVWAERYPNAAGQLRRWVAWPQPADPTQDQPWMRALVTLTRTQV